jgi:hypothetical protein
MNLSSLTDAIAAPLVIIPLCNGIRFTVGEFSPDLLQGSDIMKKLTFMFIAAAAFALTACGGKGESSAAAIAAGEPSQRIDYFASHGWEVEEVSEQSVTIPHSFSAVYEEYALMQDRQGLPLRKYAGRNARLFTYEVKNYSPDSKKMLAELLVCDNTAVASMVYSEDSGSIKMPVS